MTQAGHGPYQLDPFDHITHIHFPKGDKYTRILIATMDFHLCTRLTSPAFTPSRMDQLITQTGQNNFRHQVRMVDAASLAGLEVPTDWCRNLTLDHLHFREFWDPNKVRGRAIIDALHEWGDQIGKDGFSRTDPDYQKVQFCIGLEPFEEEQGRLARLHRGPKLPLGPISFEYRASSMFSAYVPVPGNPYGPAGPGQYVPPLYPRDSGPVGGTWTVEVKEYVLRLPEKLLVVEDDPNASKVLRDYQLLKVVNAAAERVVFTGGPYPAPRAAGLGCDGTGFGGGTCQLPFTQLPPEALPHEDARYHGDYGDEVFFMLIYELPVPYVPPPPTP